MNKEIVDVRKTENLTYLEALQALKLGKNVELLAYEIIGWEDLNVDENISVLLSDDIKFRIKQTKREVVVNGKKFYAEINELKFKEQYYIPDITDNEFYCHLTWSNDSWDNRYLERGIVFLNKKDAIGYAKAVLGIED